MFSRDLYFTDHDGEDQHGKAHAEHLTDQAHGLQSGISLKNSP